MEGFISNVNSQEHLKIVLCSVSLMLTLIKCIDILFKTLISETSGWFWKTHSAHYVFGVEKFQAKPVFFFIIFGGELLLLIGLC